MKTTGTRQEVWDGAASRTRGGLTKSDLTQSRTGGIVSKRMSEAARARWATKHPKVETPKKPVAKKAVVKKRKAAAVTDTASASGDPAPRVAEVSGADSSDTWSQSG